MPWSDVFKQITDKSVFRGSRSNILGSLLWLFFTAATATALQNMFGKSLAITIAFAVLTVGIGVAALAAYWFALRKDPNLLRTENYHIQKQMIEKGLIIGDSESGPRLLDSNPELVIDSTENNSRLSQDHE